MLWTTYTHVGDHQYCGRFYDLLERLKRVDVDTKKSNKVLYLQDSMPALN